MIYSENIKGNVDSEDPVSGNIDSDDAIPGTVSTGSSSARIIFPFPSVAYFPLMGKSNALYIDKSAKPNVAYRWDSDESAYVMVGGSGGSGGVSDYTQLSNLPMINGNILTGDLSSTELGIGDGEDGGYYVPSVDADGNLSWSASNEDMPDVDSANIKGDDGVGILSVEQTTTSTEDNGENIVTVTKTDGSQSTFKVKNGSKGNNGISPTIETSEIEDGHEVRINDINGKKSFNVLNGSIGIYVSKNETREEARAKALAAGKRLIIYLDAIPDAELVTAKTFPDYFNAANGLVLLWEGAWSSSTLTVSKENGSSGCTGKGNISDCSQILLVASDAGYICDLSNSVIVGGDNFSASNGAFCMRNFKHSISGNVLTYGNSKYTYYASGFVAPTNTTQTYRKIYGIPTR